MTEVAWAAGRALVAKATVERAVREALLEGGAPGRELSVVFVRAATLTRMHAELLGDGGATDVISIELGSQGGGPSGELYVSVDRAREVAAVRGLSLERELLLYVVHGTLHLCGFDDRRARDRARMRAAERRVLAILGFEREASTRPFEYD